MASPLRLPPASSFTSVARPANASLARSYVAGSYQCRSFSQASQRWAAKFHNKLPPRAAQPSMKNRIKEMPTQNLPTDIGLLPGTFVRPLWKDMPSVFETPKERWLMEWTWLKSAFQNFLGLIYFCKKETKTPLQLRERRKLARKLQTDMYSAFARGDDSRLRRMCCDNLYKKLSAQIAARPKDQQMSWSLVKYLRTPNTFFTGLRVLSDRGTTIPDLPNSSVRQVVLRVTSRQSTTKAKLSPSGELDDSTAETKEQDCTEYIVIQKIRWNGKGPGWQIWGHTKPTTLDTVQNDPHFAPGLSAMDRLDAIKNSMERK